MDAAIQRSIQAIHAAGCQCVLEFAGAGSLALAWLHAVPGSSRTILEATDRYSADSIADLLGAEPAKFVVPATAAAMAQLAYLRAWQMGQGDRPKLGVACTATIATDRIKRGRHRCCLAMCDAKSITTWDLVLAKGKRDRHGEESLIANLLVDLLAKSAGATRPPRPKLIGREKVVSHRINQPDPLDLLWRGKTRWVSIDAAGARRAEGRVRGIVYCGSFNPLHYGHQAMVAAAQRATGLPLTFELAAINAEKTPIDRAELERRLGQFANRHAVVVTRQPLFSQKAKLFPGCAFLIGYDTAVRLLDPWFYGGSLTRRDRALGQIAASGCRVIVAGRAVGGKFKTLGDLPIPSRWRKLFSELSGFRADVSATDLREKKR